VIPADPGKEVSRLVKDSYFTEKPTGACIIYLMGPVEGTNKWIITGCQTYPMHRGKGFAHRLMQEVIADADREGVTLILSAEAQGWDNQKKPGLTQDALEAWYKRLGFMQIDPTNPRYMERR
jgi:GNAT superfamily N-acetyltransferase